MTCKWSREHHNLLFTRQSFPFWTRSTLSTGRPFPCASYGSRSRRCHVFYRCSCTLRPQGSHTPWKPWKVLEFKNILSRPWKDLKLTVDLEKSWFLNWNRVRTTSPIVGRQLTCCKHLGPNSSCAVACSTKMRSRTRCFACNNIIGVWFAFARV